MPRFALLLLATAALCTAQVPRKAIQPAGAAKPLGPYSHGILAGNFLYVSGQGARNAKAELPPTIEGQIRQSLDNVKAIVTAAGLTMDHVVFTEVFLLDVKNYDILNRIWGEYFTKSRPARSIAGVEAMPAANPVEINAIAIRNLRTRQEPKMPAPRMGAPISSGVQVGNRFYLGGIVGRNLPREAAPNDPRAQVDLMLERASQVLGAAGLELRHLVSATIYVDNKIPGDALAKIIADVIPSETAVTVVRTAALPLDAHIEISGVASRNIRREGNCSSIGETLYCRARAGSIDIVLGNLKKDLDAARTRMDRAVQASVFIDHIDNYAAVNKVYAGAFGATPPARTLVQPDVGAPELSLAPTTDAAAPKGNGPMVELSVVAVR